MADKDTVPTTGDSRIPTFRIEGQPELENALNTLAAGIEANRRAIPQFVDSNQIRKVESAGGVAFEFTDVSEKNFPGRFVIHFDTDKQKLYIHNGSIMFVTVIAEPEHDWPYDDLPKDWWSYGRQFKVEHTVVVPEVDGTSIDVEYSSTQDYANFSIGSSYAGKTFTVMLKACGAEAEIILHEEGNTLPTLPYGWVWYRIGKVEFEDLGDGVIGIPENGITQEWESDITLASFVCGESSAGSSSSSESSSESSESSEGSSGPPAEESSASSGSSESSGGGGEPEECEVVCVTHVNGSSEGQGELQRVAGAGVTYAGKLTRRRDGATAGAELIYSPLQKVWALYVSGVFEAKLASTNSGCPEEGTYGNWEVVAGECPSESSVSGDGDDEDECTVVCVTHSDGKNEGQGELTKVYGAGPTFAGELTRWRDGATADAELVYNALQKAWYLFINGAGVGSLTGGDDDCPPEGMYGIFDVAIGPCPSEESESEECTELCAVNDNLKVQVDMVRVNQYLFQGYFEANQLDLKYDAGTGGGVWNLFHNGYAAGWDYGPLSCPVEGEYGTWTITIGPCSISSSGGDGGGGPSGSSSSSGGGEPGESKSTAIVKASFYESGYAALYIHEGPEVRFSDVLEVPIRGRVTTARIDFRFLEVCERASVQAVGVVGDRPGPIGVEIKGKHVVITTSAFPWLRPRKVTINLSGIRSGFAGRRFGERTKKQYDENNATIASAYSGSK